DLLVNYGLVAAFERRLAGEYLVEHQAQAVDVAAVIDLQTASLFRRHVDWRADAGSGHRHTRQHLAAGDAEVHQLYRLWLQTRFLVFADAATNDHHVGGLDVAVNDAGRVDVLKGPHYSFHDVDTEFGVEFAGFDVTLEAAAVDE